MVAIDYDDTSHTYRVGGVVRPHVTGILGPLYDWEKVPPDVLERASLKGRYVHKAVELFERGDLDDSTLDDEIGGYLAAYRLFRQETGYEPELVEHKVFHAALGYCGTLDSAGLLYDKPAVIDLKSGARSRVHGVQIAGYTMAKCSMEGTSIWPRRYALYLKENGRYKLDPFNDPSDFQTFAAMVSLNNWRAKHAA